MWLGGTDGDFDLYDLSGNKYEAGHSLWHGQHNAEFFGSNPTESDGGDAVTRYKVEWDTSSAFDSV